MNSNSDNETNSNNHNKETECFLRNIDFQSSVKKYEFEWREISQYLLSNNLKELKKIAIKGNLKTSKFRSVCWSLCFGLLNLESSKLWAEQRKQQRKQYTDLKEKYCLNPHFVEDKNDDPLSQNDNSLWNQHFCDQELCAVIKQDVVRTFPGIDFFRKSQIQEIMISVLFCYARENPKMCYRQGMHEILAPILFVIHSDNQAFLHFQQLNDNFDLILADILDARSLEEDSFLLFSHVMSVIESFYRINDLVPTSTGYFPSSPTMILTPDEITNANRINEIEIADQLNLIRDQILAKQDLILHNHLLQMDIPLAIFGIRWLRLLFGREFPLQDLLILWDAIFAESDNFSLTNYIVVAMLISIREKLLASDYTACLTLLMKFPNTVEISHVIKLALHMKSPLLYPNPNTENCTDTNLSVMRDKYSTLPKNFMPRHSIAAPQKTPLKVNDVNQRRASTTLDQTRLLENKRASIARVNGIHTITARAAMQVAAKHNIGETELGIIDGYFENDPEVSILTLQHAQSIMAISRFKLIQYLALLRKTMSDNQNPNIINALDGIEEVCSLLKNTYSTPVFQSVKQNIPVPVDLAFEANELAEQQNQKIKKKNLTLELQSSTNFPSTSAVKPTITENQDVRQKPVELVKKNFSNVLEKTYNYEIPENNRIANQFFGNVREIPMKIFKSATSAESKMNLDDFTATMPLIDPTLERDRSFEYDN